ncbi:MAG: YbfB/YjiJ family MFS transporter, partial [Planctomycetes bacterium]|nr:YbfB/YjiJ family MFS transporter [Planctomycetota bacterium]
MREDAALSVAAGGWLAAANYLGYLLGALAALRWRVRPSVALRSGLVAIALATLAMGGAPSALALGDGVVYVGGAWGVRVVDTGVIEAPTIVRDVPLASAPGAMATAGTWLAAALGATDGAPLPTTAALSIGPVATFSGASHRAPAAITRSGWPIRRKTTSPSCTATWVVRPSC